jgi:tRNA dimethylallyltransferase
LFEKGYTPDDPGMRAIGYREFFVDAAALGTIGEDGGEAHPRRYTFVSGAESDAKTKIEGVREMIKQNSRHYAKRQETFFKGIRHTCRFIIGRDANDGGKNGGEDERAVSMSLRALVKDFWDSRHA